MVQIKNRKTGLYDKKGCHGWSKKGGAWGSMSQAKSHVALMDVSKYKIPEYLESDFIELTENNQIIITPVAEYLIPRIQEKIDKRKNSRYIDTREDAQGLENLIKNYK